MHWPGRWRTCCPCVGHHPRPVRRVEFTQRFSRIGLFLGLATVLVLGVQLKALVRQYRRKALVNDHLGGILTGGAELWLGRVKATLGVQDFFLVASFAGTSPLALAHGATVVSVKRL